MIILDTHVWVWWVHGDEKLPKDYAQAIGEHESDGLGRKRYLVLGGRQARRIWPTCFARHARRVDERGACVSRRSVAESNPTNHHRIESAPAPFHKDPADQIIVATAREYGCELATLDGKIRSYAHVKLLR